MMLGLSRFMLTKPKPALRSTEPWDWVPLPACLAWQGGGATWHCGQLQDLQLPWVVLRWARDGRLSVICKANKTRQPGKVAGGWQS